MRKGVTIHVYVYCAVGHQCWEWAIYGDRAATVTVEASSEYNDEGGYYWNVTRATVRDADDTPCVLDFRLPFWQDADAPWWVPYVIRTDGAADTLVLTYDYQEPLRAAVQEHLVRPAQGYAWVVDTFNYDRDMREVVVRWRVTSVYQGTPYRHGDSVEQRYPVDDLLAHRDDVAGFDAETVRVRYAASDLVLPLDETVREWFQEWDAYGDYALAVDDESETTYDLGTPPEISFAALYMVKASPNQTA